MTQLSEHEGSAVDEPAVDQAAIDEAAVDDPELTAPDAAWDGRHKATLAIIALAGLLVSLTQSLLVPVLPELARDLGGSTSSIEWVLTSTLLVGAVAVPVFGRLGDLYGKKLMILVSSAAMVVGSAVCALSHSLGGMIVGRAITGLAVATIPLGISLISSVLPGKHRGTGIALISATLGIGGALGLPLAGVVAEHWDYHALFWICVAGGLISLVGVALAATEPPRTAHGRMDYVGTVLLAIGLVSLLLPLAQATEWGWGDVKTIGLLAVAVVVLGVLVLVERRTASPLIDMVVNARPALLLTNVASLCVGFALFASLIGTASYVQAPAASGYGFGSSIVQSGLTLLPSGLAMLALSPVSAKMSAAFGPKITLAVGATVVALGFGMRIVLVGSLWEIVLGTTVAGAGTGIAYAAMPSLVLRGAPASELAAANGLNALARSVGSSLASAVGGTVLAAHVIMLGQYALPSLTGYRILFGLSAGAALLGAVVSLVIPKGVEPAGHAHAAH
jgi:MFS family permease